MNVEVEFFRWRTGSLQPRVRLGEVMPSAPVVWSAQAGRNTVRRSYRLLRLSGVERLDARMIVAALLEAGDAARWARVRLVGGGGR